MSAKHGKYIPLCRDDEPDEEFVHGHVTIQEAGEALNKWSRGMGDGLTAVAHKWARWVPVRGGDFDMELKIVDGPGRGVFAITKATWAATPSSQGGQG